MSQYTTISTKCPNCGNRVEIETEDTPGEISGNAGYVLQCSACARPFALRIGGNIKMSPVRLGATVLETYYYDVAGSLDSALSRHGLV